MINRYINYYYTRYINYYNNNDNKNDFALKHIAKQNSKEQCPLEQGIGGSF